VIDVEYERVQSVGRYFRVAVLCVDMYADQLGYVDGRLVTLISMEIRDHLEALRVQQMSSRSRQRHHARNAVVSNSSLPSSVAVIRHIDVDDDDMVTSAGAGIEHDTDIWGDWSNFEELSLPCANSEWINAGTQTEPVEFREAPSIVYHAGTQTSALQTLSVTVMPISDK